MVIDKRKDLIEALMETTDVGPVTSERHHPRDLTSS